jgi:gamma-glutamyltranspeptidase/glutathione hydrolase
MFRLPTIAIAVFVVGLSLPFTGRGAEPAATARNGMVVSVSAPASEVGIQIQKQGGNAVDSAVATAFALAVTYPIAGNIGGGGFMVIHPPHASPVVIEYRETAPAKATRDMYVHQTDEYGHSVVGVPGTVRGLAEAHAKFGKLAWKDVVLPAVKLAEEGFTLDSYTAGSLNSLVATSSSFPELIRVFGKNGGNDDWRTGDKLIQPDLARTLRQIAEQGPDAFYTGKIAEQITTEMAAGGGLVSRDDLAGYKAHVCQPVHGTYRGYDVYGAPPPSSGGIGLVEMLNILENFNLAAHERFSPETVHLMAEAMRRTYCDRARFLGDPEFTKIPSQLTSKEYARELAHGIKPDRATPSAELGPELLSTKDSDNTTHFSVIDRDGLAVSNTYTLEHGYGSKVVVRGAGFLLNNEMCDFNWKPGVTNRKGTIGTEPNVIVPGKRMLSSQSPTIIAKDGKVFLVTGSPGSRTIINTVLCVVVNVIDYKMDVQSAVDAPRMHQQWFPDVLNLEQTSKYPDLVSSLKKMGYVVRGHGQGDAHSILVDPKSGIYSGGVDRRIMGNASGY